MTSPMTDEMAIALVHWLTHGSDFKQPPPADVSLKSAYDHITARLAEPGAVHWRQAVQEFRSYGNVDDANAIEQRARELAKKVAAE